MNKFVFGYVLYFPLMNLFTISLYGYIEFQEP